MGPESLAALAAGVFCIALLYSSVGHAGASGYIAVMTLLSVAPASIKPVALALNIMVASIGSWQFWRAGYFSWTLFWPFALLAVPLAFVGGALQLPATHFKMLLGVILLYSAWRFLVRPAAERPARPPARWQALGSGGVIGLLSGLTGTGGGIFLTPLLLLMRWATVKHAAAISAVFILLNSIAGLLGHVSSTRSFPSFVLLLVAAAALGGSIGSYWGSRRLDPVVIKRFLALVLLIAGTKLLLG